MSTYEMFESYYIFICQKTFKLFEFSAFFKKVSQMNGFFIELFYVTEDIILIAFVFRPNSEM